MPKLSFIELIKNLFLTKNKQQDELSTWINQNLNEDVAQAFIIELFPGFAEYYKANRSDLLDGMIDKPATIAVIGKDSKESDNNKSRNNHTLKVFKFNDEIICTRISHQKNGSIFGEDAVKEFFRRAKKKKGDSDSYTYVGKPAPPRPTAPKKKKGDSDSYTYRQKLLLLGFSDYLTTINDLGYHRDKKDTEIYELVADKDRIEQIIVDITEKHEIYSGDFPDVLKKVLFHKLKEFNNSNRETDKQKSIGLELITILAVVSIFPDEWSEHLEKFLTTYYNDIINPPETTDRISADMAITPQPEEYNSVAFTLLLREICQNNAKYADSFGRLVSFGKLENRIVEGDIPNLRPSKNGVDACCTLNQLIEGEDSIMCLCGEGGIGKTVSLISTAKRLSKEGELFPFYISLSLFCSENKSFMAYIEEQSKDWLSDYEAGRFQSLLTKWLCDQTTNSTLLLLLDGFNEVSKESQQYVLSKLHSEFFSGSVNKKVRVVLTSREEPFLGNNDFADSFKLYYIDELSLDTAKKYLDLLIKVKPEQYYSEIENGNGELVPFLRTPMAISMYCYMKNNENTRNGLPYPSPTTKGELMGNYVSLLTAKTNATGSIAFLAYNMAVSGEIAISSHRAHDYFKIRESDPDTVNDLGKFNDIFNATWYGDRLRTIAFKHQDLRDYYAAYYCITCFDRGAEEINACFGNRIPKEVLYLFADLCEEHRFLNDSSLIQETLSEVGSSLSAVAVSQIIKAVQYARKNDLSTMDFIGLDLTRTGLNGVILSTDDNKAVFGNAKISDRTFLPIGRHTVTNYNNIHQLLVKDRYLLSFGEEVLFYDMKNGIWDVCSKNFDGRRVVATAEISNDSIALVFTDNIDTIVRHSDRFSEMLAVFLKENHISESCAPFDKETMVDSMVELINNLITLNTNKAAETPVLVSCQDINVTINSFWGELIDGWKPREFKSEDIEILEESLLKFIGEYIDDSSNELIDEQKDIVSYRICRIYVSDDSISLNLDEDSCVKFNRKDEVCKELKKAYLRNGSNVEYQVVNKTVFYRTHKQQKSIPIYKCYKFNSEPHSIYAFQWKKHEYVSVITNSRDISLYEVNDGQTIMVTDLPSNSYCISFMLSDDSSIYSFYSHEKCYYKWDASKMKAITTDMYITMDSGEIAGCVLHDESPYLYSEGYDYISLSRKGEPPVYMETKHVKLGKNKNTYSAIKTFALPNKNMMVVWANDKDLVPPCDHERFFYLYCDEKNVCADGDSNKYAFVFQELNPDLTPAMKNHGGGLTKKIFSRELNFSALHSTPSGIVLESKSHDNDNLAIVCRYIPYSLLEGKTNYRDAEITDRIIPVSSLLASTILDIDEINVENNTIRALCIKVEPTNVSHCSARYCIAVYESGSNEVTQMNTIEIEFEKHSYNFIGHIKLCYYKGDFFLTFYSEEELKTFLLNRIESGEYIVVNTVIDKSFPSDIWISDVIQYREYIIVSFSDGTITRFNITDPDNIVEELYHTIPGLLCCGVDFSHTQGTLSSNLKDALKLIGKL